MIDDLLADNCRQLERLLDLYLSGDFDKEVLTDRRTRLEATITALEKERAELTIQLETTTLTEGQIKTLADLAKRLPGDWKRQKMTLKPGGTFSICSMFK